jgi:IMP cyclohydrolase
MSESQTETFTERVDVSTRPDGAFIGRLEIDVRHDDHQLERIAALIDENSALRNRVRELEALNGFD